MMNMADALPMRRLNTTLRSPKGTSVSKQLADRVVNQGRACKALVGAYDRASAKALGLAEIGKPIGSLLFLGGSGVGKTHAVEQFVNILHGDPLAMIKVDCAEYQHGHEIAKLVGSPPGYLGHRETPPQFSQKRLAEHSSLLEPITVILFDEIEKANDALWQLMLGILDKATLTLGDNTVVDFSQCLIVMTSNLGGREMAATVEGKMGFAGRPIGAGRADDQQLYKTAMAAARKHFSPEFMNRVDKSVVFRALDRDALMRILKIEVETVARRFEPQGLRFALTPAAEDLLLTEGEDARYGARHIKRSIERFLTSGLTSIVLSSQVPHGQTVLVGTSGDGGLEFMV